MNRYRMIPKIDINELRERDDLKRFEPETISGVYFLIKKDKVIYVGQSVDVASRIKTHTTAKDFDQVFYIEYPESELVEREFEFILALEPPLNKSHSYARERNREKREMYTHPRGANGRFINANNGG